MTSCLVVKMVSWLFEIRLLKCTIIVAVVEGFHVMDHGGGI